MVEQRQLGERYRIKGNNLYKEKRFSEAHQAYEVGLSHDRHNMALHANAALCSLKMECHVEAIEHADKVGFHQVPVMWLPCASCAA